MSKSSAETLPTIFNSPDLWEHKFIEADGYKTSYAEAGDPDAEPLILVHGGACEIGMGFSRWYQISFRSPKNFMFSPSMNWAAAILTCRGFALIGQRSFPRRSCHCFYGCAELRPQMASCRSIPRRLDRHLYCDHPARPCRKARLDRQREHVRFRHSPRRQGRRTIHRRQSPKSESRW